MQLTFVNDTICTKLAFFPFSRVPTGRFVYILPIVKKLLKYSGEVFCMRKNVYFDEKYVWKSVK